MKKALILIAFIAFATTNYSFAQSKTSTALNQVLTTYYAVKNALATDKKDVAIEKAKILATKVEAVPHKEFPADQHNVWMEQSAIMKSKIVELTAAKDIKAERKAFEGISNAMITSLKTIKFNNATTYVEYCPMAKASWLNEKKDIENPYYGSMMFDCGSVKETIKVN
ncbi:DUF3347 domain-containing protein [Pedobacter sp. MW01-1-1]|uniref:DUF3347 domain-containing protein n=1 Tax=Pedobacter sp. MW01-1-1 TaxID=3383027 RepID=UPI003FEDE6B3